MKKCQILYYIALVSLLTGCQPRCSNEVVCETYVHRYGVPLDPQDWSERGQHGQVISTRKDGVVVSKTYEAGVLNGEVTYTFPHRDVIARRCFYSNGHLDQETYCYSNGMPHKQISYDDAQENVLCWYESGAPQLKETYINGLLIQGEYFDLSQQRESSVLDQNGLRTLRDDYGELLSVDEIEHGQLVLRRTYHSNGAPEAVTPYSNGVIEGKRWTYQPGGEPATLEEWNNNFQHGNTEVFENGEKIADRPYVYGKIHGVERCYREGGNLVQENHWTQGEKHGRCHNYFNGERRTDWYFKNRLVNRGTYEALCNQ